MKRYLVGLTLAIAGVMLITGCEKSEKSKEKETVEVTTKESDEVKSLTYVIGDKKVSLPCSYEDIKKVGFDFKKKKDKNTPIENNYQSSGITFKNKKGDQIKVYFANTTGGNAYTKDCQIFRIFANSNKSNVKVVKGNEFTVDFNSTYEDVEKVMGIPYFKYNEEGEEFSTLKYKDSVGSISYVFKNGKLHQIDMSKPVELWSEESTTEEPTMVETTTSEPTTAKEDVETSIPTETVTPNKPPKNTVKVAATHSKKKAKKSNKANMITSVIGWFVVVVVCVVFVFTLILRWYRVRSERKNKKKRK